jgi:hypothetical protein
VRHLVHLSHNHTFQHHYVHVIRVGAHTGIPQPVKQQLAVLAQTAGVHAQHHSYGHERAAGTMHDLRALK